jgi:hypothetical protein
MIITYKLVVYNSFSIHPLMTLASKHSNDYRFSFHFLLCEPTMAITTALVFEPTI